MSPTAQRKSFLADVIIGAHGTFCQWCFDLIETMRELTQGRPIMRIDRFQRVDFAVTLRPIVITHYPGVQLIDAIERHDVRVLFLSEPPNLTLRYMQGSLSIPFKDALRSQTASAVGNLAIGRSPHTRIIERDASRTVAQMVARIADQLELDLTLAQLHEVAQTASRGHGADATIEDVLRSTWPDAVAVSADGEAQERVCQDILDPLLAMARGNPVRPVVWPTDVFTFHDNPTSAPPSDPVIAGPSRDLYYGPYLYLPPGHYRVEVFLLFSDEIRKVPFVIEVHAGSWLARARIEERHPGRFRGYFKLDHYDATSTVEIRLRNEEPVSSGRLVLVELLFFAEGELSLN